ncbi:MAG: hypothetical protein IK089_06110 [Oxalobacter sp.]|nr:hypothetical protein [Oxalobacter sp.]
MRHLQTARLSKGFTLVETLLVLGFAGILIAGAMGLYMVSRASTTAIQVANDIDIVSQIMERYFMGYGRPANNTSLNQMLIDSGKLPSSVRNTAESNLSNAYGGTLTTNYNAGTYTVTVSNIPRSGCIAIATSLPAKWDSITIGEGDAITTVPMTVAAAEAACGESQSITVAREFF